MCGPGSIKPFNKVVVFSNVDLQAPKWTQVAPKSSQDSAKIAPTLPKMASKAPKRAPTIIKKPEGRCCSAILSIFLMRMFC